MKLLIITGASAGIGLATAERFIQEGWAVVNISRRACPLPSVTSVQADLSQPGFCDTISAAVLPLLQTADQVCVIHNAARLVNDALGGLSDDSFRRVLEINLVAPNALNNLLRPHLSSGSSILYVGSTLSEKAVSNSLSYVTSKHGQAGMMKATCQDLVGSGVHTALICPGFTDTEMLRTHVNNDPGVLEAVGALSAFNRLVEPDEIAQTLWFCAGAPVINGAIIHANLGQIES